MKHRITVHAAYVEIVAVGKADFEGFRRLIHDFVEHPDTRSGMRLLLDYRQLETREQASIYRSAERIAAEMYRFRDRIAPEKMAILLTDPSGELEGSLVQSIREFHGMAIPTGHFQAPEQALEWLLASS